MLPTTMVTPGDVAALLPVAGKQGLGLDVLCAIVGAESGCHGVTDDIMTRRANQRGVGAHQVVTTRQSDVVCANCLPTAGTGRLRCCNRSKAKTGSDTRHDFIVRQLKPRRRWQRAQPSTGTLAQLLSKQHDARLSF
jgi:hypothetical protein